MIACVFKLVLADLVQSRNLCPEQGQEICLLIDGRLLSNLRLVLKEICLLIDGRLLSNLRLVLKNSEKLVMGLYSHLLDEEILGSFRNIALIISRYSHVHVLPDYADDPECVGLRNCISECFRCVAV